MGGGPSQSQINTQGAIQQQQLDLAKNLYDFGQARVARSDALQQPLIDYLNKQIFGNTTTQIQGAAVPIANITQGYEGAKQRIMDSTAPGAARDYALTQLEQNKATAIPTFLNQSYLSAFPALANLSGAQLQAGIQGFGGATSNYGGAASTGQGVLQAQAASQQAKMGALGDIFGALGGAVGSYVASPYKLFG